MSRFLKQFVFVASVIAILMVGGLAIYSATPQGKLKVNPILGHDLDLNALYYGQAADNTVHDITTQDISVSAWVKVDVDASGVNPRIVAKAATPGYLFYVPSILRFYIRDAAGDNYYISGSTDLRDNKWHYVTGIIDRSDATQCKLFVDGVDNTASRTGTLSSVDSLENTTIFDIGALGVGSDKLDGQIRDVKLYYAAGDHWSDAQVLYQAQHPFDYSTLAGTLTDYWRLDEGSGTTLYGKVNNLTLSNVLAWTTQPKLKVVNQENATSSSNNPVGWWKMDEGTASSSFDSSGNGNTGTLTGGVQWATGKLGKGLSFDGVNDYVDITSVSPGLAQDAMTISTWIKPIANGNIVSLDYSQTISGGILFSNTTFSMQLASGGAKAVSITGVTLGYWHNLVVTKNSDKQIYIYLDGLRIVSDSHNLTGTLVNNVGRFIGKRDAVTTPGYFNGIIDDVRIYNRALTDSEVAQMYNSTKDGYLGNIKVSTGLVGYWKLDDNNALTSVIDYSGKGNTGTAYSGTATSTSVLSTSTAMVGRAMSFDGVDDYISVASSFPDWNNEFTFSMWIKPFISEGDRVAIRNIGNFAIKPHIAFFINIGGVVRTALLLNTTDFPIGQWTHAVFTVKATTYGGDGIVRFYRNGILTSQSIAYTGNLSVGVLDYIGTSLTAGEYFNGLIDEVKIWNRALTAAEIQQDYVRGASHLPY